MKLVNVQDCSATLDSNLDPNVNSWEKGFVTPHVSDVTGVIVLTLCV